MKDKLALYLILKDEAESIEEVIKSFWLNGAPIYDRLIISIDSATTDNIHEIVIKYTSEITYFDWQDNFNKPTDIKGKVCSKINNNIELLKKTIAKSNNMEIYTEVEDRLNVS